MYCHGGVSAPSIKPALSIERGRRNDFLRCRPEGSRTVTATDRCAGATDDTGHLAPRLPTSQ